MTPRYRSLRGLHDWTPEEQPYYRWIDRTIREVAARYGHLPIDTPVLEQTEVFARGVGAGTDIVEKEMYSFETPGGEAVTVRPEFTAGIARAYLEHALYNLPQPVKLVATGPLLRYERPGMGRYRQHVQASVEVIGEEDPAVDAEMISLARDIFAVLGIGALRVEVNSIGCPDCRPAYLEQVLVPWLTARRDRLGEQDRLRLEKNPLRVLDTKDPAVRALLVDVPLLRDHLCEACRADFALLLDYLALLSVPHEVNPLLVRGLDYYTRTVFEVKSDALDTANNTITAGGRYDVLIELLGGSPTPGIGMGIGFERIRLVLGELGIEPPPLPAPQLFAVWFDDATKRAALAQLHLLRQAGIRADMAYARGRRSFKSQMRAADKSPARYTLIFGADELARGQVGVKEMESGSQATVALDDLLPWLTERLHGEAE